MTELNAAKWWQLYTWLCRRFKREPDRDEAGDYLEYFEASALDDAQVEREARCAWATREFFPRPADFLGGQAAAGWTAVLAAANKFRRQQTVEDYAAVRATIPDRAWKALGALGGWTTVSEARDLLKLRAAFFDAFDKVVVEEIAGPTLPSLPPPQEITAPVLRERSTDTAGPERVGVSLGRIPKPKGAR